MLVTVFSRLGQLVARHPRLTVVIWVVLTAAGFATATLGVHGESLFDRVTTGEPVVPGSQSATANQILADANDSGPSITLIVSGVDPKDPELAQAMSTVNKDLVAIEGTTNPIDPYVLEGGVENPAATPLLAKDGKGFIVDVTLRGDLDADQQAKAANAVQDRLGEVAGDLRDSVPSASKATGLVSSSALIVKAITDQVEKDLTTGELIALPIALFVMLMVFGGFLAAGMPMAGALASIGTGLAALLGITYVIDVDASVVNVVTVLGLGLSIDYGLLIVSRYREELGRLIAAEDTPHRRRGDGVVRQALITTMATAGRTVAFSAITVAASIAGLMVFVPEILRSVGAGGLAVVLIAVATALTLVPALLAFSGRRLAKPGILDRIPGVRRVLARTADVQSDEGFLSRLTGRVQRHPWFVLVGCLVVLGVLASPIAGLQLRNSGIELLPASSPQREFVDTLATQYPAARTPSVIVVTDTSPEGSAAMGNKILGLDGVASVEEPIAVGNYSRIGVHLDTDDPGGKDGVNVVKEIRALDPGFDYWVTGQAANQVDFSESLGDRVVWAVLVVVLATFILLFLMTGSVLIPIKALLTNALSLAASLGVLTWAFQQGHLEGVLGFTSPGGIETYVIAMVIAFAFGLAMDYEVFLLSRVKELHDSGHTNNEALRIGLQRSGRIITSAATIIIVVFAGFIFGQLLVIKEVGFALAVAVFIDATLVRLLLVPATMTLLGKWNWWAPKPMKRVYEKLSLTH